MKVMNNNIPAMTPPVVHDYLRGIGKQWTGQGVAMELGCWFGATTVPLLEGLVEAGYDRPFYAFDRWTANAEEAMKAQKAGVFVKSGQDLYPMFRNNVRKVFTGNLVAVQGHIPESLHKFSGEAIEICLFDAPKREPIFSKSVQLLHKHWIPGVTILGLLDYYFYKVHRGLKREWFLAPVEFMQKNRGCFTLLTHWPDQCARAFFRYDKPLKSI